MAAVVMDQAVVEPRAMVAAGALVTPRKTVPSGQLWGGRPARFMRALSEAEMADIRSEEHTSELQSLMRISYAVFCLKKKNNDMKATINQSYNQQHSVIT